MRLSIVALLVSMGTLTASPTFSQQTKFNVAYRNVALTEVLKDLKQKSGCQFAYFKEDIPDNLMVTVRKSDATLAEVLDEVLVKNNFTYRIQDETIFITRAEKSQQPQQPRQPQPFKVSGRVLDDGRVPMVGVTVIVVGSTVGTVTDAHGNFSISVREGDVLMFTCIGYKNTSVPVTKDTRDPVIVLKQESVAVQEVVVTGMGVEQRKEAVVGAVTTIDTRTLKSSNSDLTAALIGNAAGVIGWQISGIPGALTEAEMNTKFYIRGITSFQANANTDPLILLDGVESSKLDLARIDPEDIASLSILKDASATAMYGARGANGVIYVTTKKGRSGSVYTSARYEAIATMPTSDIDVIDPVSYMELYNETTLGRNPLSVPKYTREQIQNTKNPNIPYYVYPANDWYNILFKPMSVNHHMGVNIRGGSDVVQYYASLNYNQDNGMLKTDRLNQFDVNIKNQGMTLRVNLNIDLNKGIKLVVNSFSTFDKYHGPMTDVRQAYYMAFKASPVDFAVTYPADDYYKWDHIRFGGSKTSYNPYASIHEGYSDRMRYSTINRAEYIQNLGFVTKGLEFRGSASLSQEGYFSTSFSTSPYYYSLKDYDFTTGQHKLLPVNEGEGNRILASIPKNAVSTGATRMAFDLRLLHNAAWGDHQTSFTGLFNMQEAFSSLPATLFKSFPQRNIGLAGNLSYGFRERYYAEGSFGYNGSERFAKNNRMGFFPALGASWVISREDFMRPLDKIVPFLKMRFSWGKVGNDGVIDDPRFAHLSTIDMVRTSVSRPGAMNEYAYIVRNYANEKVTWEVAEQVNLGLDMKLFGAGMLEVNADIYREIRHNVLDYRTTIPASLGLTMPALDNVGKVDSRGVDIALKFQHAFTQNLWVILNGTFTYSRAKFLKIEEASNKPDWQIKKGREISQAFGYIAEGLFQDEAEIRNSPFQGGNVMPGDIRYRDINDDGKIDVYDAVPIGYPETPRLIYGFNAFINYKNLEFSFAFQGMGQRSFFIDPKAISPFDGNNAVLQKIADDHWTAQNAANKPFWPRLSTANIVQHNPQEDRSANAEIRKSTYFMYDGQFLRCRSIELGYNLPKAWAEGIRLKNVKVFARANNPFIISSFKVWDIELGSGGFNYPIQKTYSAGINVTF